MNERQKGRCEFVVARGDPPEVLDASEEAFDQIAVSVEMAIEAALGKTIGAGKKNPCVDFGIHPDALAAPQRYNELFDEQVVWYRGLVGTPPQLVAESRYSE